MKIKILFEISILIILISIVNAETLISDLGVEYDSKIVDAFEIQSELRVLVRLKDNSNIVFNNSISSEQRKILIEQRDAWFRPKIDEVLSDISEDNIWSVEKLRTGFGALITKEGFDKLVNDPKVSGIYLDTGGSVALDESVPDINADQVWNLSQCIEEKQKSFGPIENFATGIIGIVFNEGVNKEEAIDLLESNNLTIDQNKFPKYITLIIPKGTELEQICNLEESNLVNYGTLLSLGTSVVSDSEIPVIIPDQKESKVKEFPFSILALGISILIIIIYLIWRKIRK